MSITHFLQEKIPVSLQKRWRNHRDAIVLEDLERSFVSARDICSSDTYLPADFLFILASYAFARREKDKAIELCESIQTSYPGYDPSKRFSSLPSPQDDLVTLMKEAHLAQDAEGFLKRFLTTYSGYTFSDFSPYFPLEKDLNRTIFLRLLLSP